MRLRTNVRAPGRYREEDEDYLPPNPTFVVPTIPYDPTLRPAVFPTLEFNQLPFDHPSVLAEQRESEKSDKGKERDNEVRRPALVFRDSRTVPIMEDDHGMSRGPGGRWTSTLQPGAFDQFAGSEYDLDADEDENEVGVQERWVPPALMHQKYWADLSKAMKLVVIRELTGHMVFLDAISFLQIGDEELDDFLQLCAEEALIQRNVEVRTARIQERQTDYIADGGDINGEGWDRIYDEELSGDNRMPATWIISKAEIDVAKNFMGNYRFREEFGEVEGVDIEEISRLPTFAVLSSIQDRLELYMGVTTTFDELGDFGDDFIELLRGAMATAAARQDGTQTVDSLVVDDGVPAVVSTHGHTPAIQSPSTPSTPSSAVFETSRPQPVQKPIKKSTPKKDIERDGIENSILKKRGRPRKNDNTARTPSRLREVTNASDFSPRSSPNLNGMGTRDPSTAHPTTSTPPTIPAPRRASVQNLARSPFKTFSSTSPPPKHSSSFRNDLPAQPATASPPKGLSRANVDAESPLRIQLAEDTRAIKLGRDAVIDSSCSNVPQTTSGSNGAKFLEPPIAPAIDPLQESGTSQDVPVSQLASDVSAATKAQDLPIAQHITNAPGSPAAQSNAQSVTKVADALNHLHTTVTQATSDMGDLATVQEPSAVEIPVKHPKLTNIEALPIVQEKLVAKEPAVAQATSPSKETAVTRPNLTSQKAPDAQMVSSSGAAAVVPSVQKTSSHQLSPPITSPTVPKTIVEQGPTGTPKTPTKLKSNIKSAQRRSPPSSALSDPTSLASLQGSLPASSLGTPQSSPSAASRKKRLYNEIADPPTESLPKKLRAEQPDQIQQNLARKIVDNARLLGESAKSMSKKFLNPFKGISDPGTESKKSPNQLDQTITSNEGAESRLKNPEPLIGSTGPKAISGLDRDSGAEKTTNLSAAISTSNVPNDMMAVAESWETDLGNLPNASNQVGTSSTVTDMQPKTPVHISSPPEPADVLRDPQTPSKYYDFVPYSPSKSGRKSPSKSRQGSVVKADAVTRSMPLSDMAGDQNPFKDLEIKSFMPKSRSDSAEPRISTENTDSNSSIVGVKGGQMPKTPSKDTENNHEISKRPSKASPVKAIKPAEDESKKLGAPPPIIQEKTRSAAQERARTISQSSSDSVDLVRAMSSSPLSGVRSSRMQSLEASKSVIEVQIPAQKRAASEAAVGSFEQEESPAKRLKTPEASSKARSEGLKGSSQKRAASEIASESFEREGSPAKKPKTGETSPAFHARDLDGSPHSNTQAGVQAKPVVEKKKSIKKPVKRPAGRAGNRSATPRQTAASEAEDDELAAESPTGPSMLDPPTQTKGAKGKANTTKKATKKSKTTQSGPPRVESPAEVETESSKFKPPPRPGHIKAAPQPKPPAKAKKVATKVSSAKAQPPKAAASKSKAGKGQKK